jgi:hypothetical protein
MGKLLRYILLSIFGMAALSAFWAMLFEPFFDEALQRLGVNSASWVDPMIELFQTQWVQNSFFTLLGATFGAWAHFWAVRIDRRQADAALRDEKWAYGIKNISVKHAACAFSGISPREYEASPRAQAISGEIIAAGNSGLLATSIQMDAGTQKFRWFSPDNKLRFIVDDEFTNETMVDTYELFERFKGESWETAWARPNASHSLE